MQSPDAQAGKRRPLWRRIAAAAVLAAAIAGAVTQLLPALPREQTLIFRIPDGPPVKRLSASWTRIGEAAPRGGVTLNVGGKNTRRIEHQVSIPNGEYDLHVSIERTLTDTPLGPSYHAGTETGAAAAHATYNHRANLEGGVTTLRLQDQNP